MTFWVCFLLWPHRPTSPPGEALERRRGVVVTGSRRKCGLRWMECCRLNVHFSFNTILLQLKKIHEVVIMYSKVLKVKLQYVKSWYFYSERAAQSVWILNSVQVSCRDCSSDGLCTFYHMLQSLVLLSAGSTPHNDGAKCPDLPQKALCAFMMSKVCVFCDQVRSLSSLM